MSGEVKSDLTSKTQRLKEEQDALLAKIEKKKKEFVSFEREHKDLVAALKADGQEEPAVIQEQKRKLMEELHNLRSNVRSMRPEIAKHHTKVAAFETKLNKYKKESDEIDNKVVQFIALSRSSAETLRDAAMRRHRGKSEFRSYRTTSTPRHNSHRRQQSEVQFSTEPRSGSAAPLHLVVPGYGPWMMPYTKDTTLRGVLNNLKEKYPPLTTNDARILFQGRQLKTSIRGNLNDTLGSLNIGPGGTLAFIRRGGGRRKTKQRRRKSRGKSRRRHKGRRKSRRKRRSRRNRR